MADVPVEALECKNPDPADIERIQGKFNLEKEEENKPLFDENTSIEEALRGQYIDPFEEELLTEELHPALQDLNMFTPSLLDGMDSPTIIVVGKRRTGKTFFVRWLLSHMVETWPYAIVFTGTRFNYFWQNHFPDSHIYDGYQADVMKKLLERQKFLRDALERGKLPPEANIEVLVVFDDIAGSSVQDLRFRAPEMQDVFTLGRHFKITAVFMIQDAFMITPVMKNNADMVCILEQHQRRNLDALYDNFLSAYTRNKSESDRLIAQYTRVLFEPNEGAEIDPKKDDGNEDIVGKMGLVVMTGQDFRSRVNRLRWVVAHNPGPFVVGCRNYWRLAGNAPRIERPETQVLTFENFKDSRSTRKRFFS